MINITKKSHDRFDRCIYFQQYLFISGNLEGTCIYGFTDPFYPSFTLPPAQPYSPGDIQLNPNNSICLADGSSLNPGEGCNSRAFSYYEFELVQFLTTYIDATRENTSLADLIYATNHDHLNVRTIQSNQANVGLYHHSQYTQLK